MVTRRKFSREFKAEAVKLVKDWGVSVAQAARDAIADTNAGEISSMALGCAMVSGVSVIRTPCSGRRHQTKSFWPTELAKGLNGFPDLYQGLAGWQECPARQRPASPARRR